MKVFLYTVIYHEEWATLWAHSLQVLRQHDGGCGGSWCGVLLAYYLFKTSTALTHNIVVFCRYRATLLLAHLHFMAIEVCLLLCNPRVRLYASITTVVPGIRSI